MSKNRRQQASKRDRDRAKWAPTVDTQRAQEQYEELLAEFAEHADR